MSAAFFTHQGHEVFQDPCPDLTAYRRTGRFTSTIIEVNRLPDHILAAGLDLLNSLPTSSEGDILGMSFMVEYLTAPPSAVAPQGNPVSLSPPGHGRSGGSIRSFKPMALLSFSVPLRSARSDVGRSQLDPRHPHHALAGSCHRLNMGGSLALVAVSPPLPSLPQLGMGGTMAVLVVGPRHLL